MTETVEEKTIRSFPRFLRRFGFTPEASITEPYHWPPVRCGLYAWRATNGQVYLGQSIDCRRRLREHNASYGDIVAFGFKPVPRERLNSYEIRLALALERSAPIRNVKLVRKTYTLVPYDHVVSGGDHRPVLHASQSIKSARAFRRLQANPLAAEIIRITRNFVVKGIPNWEATEGMFWSVTALPGAAVRVNCGHQEIMTCSPTSDSTALTVRILSPKALDIWPKYRVYKTGSLEHVWSARQFWCFDRWHLLRPFAEYLMRHTTPLNSASHCPQLLHDEFA